jgi:iron-sulfur cluster repair protein YtfE (RIC family)
MTNIYSHLPDGPRSSNQALVQALGDWFVQDHRDCDSLWVAVEEGASTDLDATKEALGNFDSQLRNHLRMEEEVLFPAIERATGMGGMGPTEMMRQEHIGMRRLLDAMAQSDDLELILEQGDTLMMLIAQHNSKEEGVLYPLAVQVLGPVARDLISAMGLGSAS